MFDRNRTRLLGNNGSPALGLYGSLRASTFIKDCVSGADSVDVLTIGDSNMGYESCGHSTGFREALSSKGTFQYATGLAPFATSSTSIPGGTTFTGGMLANMTQFSIKGNTLEASSASGSSTISSLSAKNATGDTHAVALTTALGTFSSYKTNAFEFDAAYVNAGSPTNIYTSAGNGIRIAPTAGTAFAAGNGSGAVPLQYRVVYGTFATGSGQFKLNIVRSVNTNVARSSVYLTNTGTAGISTTAATLNFTSPKNTTSQSTPIAFGCIIDGYVGGTTADYIVGPAAFFWHSLMFQSKKGYSVTNFSYYSGRTTAQLATDMASNLKLVSATLRELRTRQIAAGGTGRVLIYTNSGINDGDTNTTYTSSLDSLIAVFRTEWTTLGYPESDLAFLITSSHPTPNSIGGEAWYERRPAFNNNAKTWATTNFTDGRNITYCDFEEYRTAAQIENSYGYSFYLNGTTSTPYAVHLRAAPVGAEAKSATVGISSMPGGGLTPGGATASFPGGSTGLTDVITSSENMYITLGNYLVSALLT